MGNDAGLGKSAAPFVTVSSPRRALTGFHVWVLGHTYSLWRKPASTELESVGTATISPADHTVALTDPQPPPAAQWYQVRTVPEAAKATGETRLRGQERLRGGPEPFVKNSERHAALSGPRGIAGACRVRGRREFCAVLEDDHVLPVEHRLHLPDPVDVHDGTARCG